MSARVIGLIAYGMSFAILLVVFYFYERAKAGPVKWITSELPGKSQTGKVVSSV